MTSGFLESIVASMEDRFRQERGSSLEWHDKAVQFGEAYARHRD
jgi:hypothetical protein